MKLQLTAQDAAGWVPPLLPVLLLWIAVSVRLRLYRAPYEVSLWNVLVWAARNTLAVFVATIVTTFFSREWGAGASRMFVLCMLPATFCILVVTRALVLAVVALVQRWSGPPRIAVIGDTANARELIGRMEAQVRSAIHGLIVPEPVPAEALGHSIPVLGTTRQVAELVNRERLDHVIVLHGSLSDAEVERCNNVFWRMGLAVSCTLDFPLERDAAASGSWAQRFQLSNRNGVRMIEMQSPRFERTQDFVKRTFDFALASLCLVAFSPVLIGVALAIKLTSPGPILERAQRVGKGGRYFSCLKFRTTYMESELHAHEPSVGKLAEKLHPVDLDHLTPLGAILRRFSLDELPQLINILFGEMSFVGPRPLPSDNLGPDGMSREFFDWSETRSRVHPGLTGLWQVSGRNNLSFDDMIRLDLEYIQNRSFSLDISILLETPMPVLRGIGAA